MSSALVCSSFSIFSRGDTNTLTFMAPIALIIDKDRRYKKEAPQCKT
jgi:hypothetical protein